MKCINIPICLLANNGEVFLKIIAPALRLDLFIVNGDHSFCVDGQVAPMTKTALKKDLDKHFLIIYPKTG